MPIESSFVETEFGKFHVESAGRGTSWLFIHGGTVAFTNPARLIGLVAVDSAGGPMTDNELAQWHARRAARRQARPTTQDVAEQDAAIEQTMREIFADPARVPPSFREDLRWQMQHAAPDQILAIWRRVGMARPSAVRSSESAGARRLGRS